jgi:AhpD family alkylhydroperoxidase
MFLLGQRVFSLSGSLLSSPGPRGAVSRGPTSGYRSCLLIFRTERVRFSMSTALPTTLSFPEQLQTIKSYMARLGAAQPATMEAFTRLHQAAAAPGALDTKTKELLALAVGVAARCDGCIAFHTHDALEAGASEGEVLDALGVAILMGGGPSVIYATHVLKAMEDFRESGR